MKILVADIGGTNSRFAGFEITGPDRYEKLGSALLLTNDQRVSCFSDLLACLDADAASTVCSPSCYDVVVFAVAGPVVNKRCIPVNIAWDVDVSSLPFRECYLLNDFVAQAYGCTDPGVLSDLIPVKEGVPREEGTVAIVGAGTGLGHCALVPHRTPQGLIHIPVPSEAGHAAFTFIGCEEREFERFVLSRIGGRYCDGDAVVSGRGLTMLHEFISGECLQPQEVVRKFDSHPKTLEIFSRFYGRACCNYCLQTLAIGALIVSGGIAAKNPAIVKSDAFISEFLDSPTQKNLLQSIPVFLNPHEDIGVLGCLLYGYNMSRMSKQVPAPLLKNH